MKSKELSIIITMVILVCLSGIAGYLVGGLNVEPKENKAPIIQEIWINKGPYPIPMDSIDIWPYYPLSYNVRVKDYEDDVMSVTFFVKQSGHWVEMQELFGRDGLYTFYYPFYIYPMEGLKAYPDGLEVKVIVSDNVNSVSKMF